MASYPFLVEDDTTQEIEAILGKSGGKTEDWISDILGKSGESFRSKIEKLEPRPRKTPKAPKAPKTPKAPKAPKTPKKSDPEFEKFLAWRSKSSPSARMIDHQISMALAHIDAKTDEIFDAIETTTEEDPPPGCDGDDAVFLRGFSEGEFRTELRKLLRKYQPAPQTPEPTY
jgi:hypothetical protein